MRSEAGGALDLLDDEGSFDDGDPYTTNLYIGRIQIPCTFGVSQRGPIEHQRPIFVVLHFASLLSLSQPSCTVLVPKCFR